MSAGEQRDHRTHAVPWKGYWALLPAFKEATRTFPAPQNGMEVITNHTYLATRDYIEAEESGVGKVLELGEFLLAGWWCLTLRGGEGGGKGVGAAWQDVGVNCVDAGVRLARSGKWGMHRGAELEYVYYTSSTKKISREIQVPWAKDRKTWLPFREKQKWERKQIFFLCQIDTN